MSASPSSATATGNVVVVTHVRPTIPSILPPPPPPAGMSPGNPADYTFHRGRAVAVGVVQIITALMILLCGSIIATLSDKVAVSSGVFVWGPVMFITAGSLTVAAGTSYSSLIKSAVGFNVAAALIAVAPTVIFFVDAFGVFKSSDPPFGHHDQEVVPTEALSGFSAMFSLLEFALSMQVAMSSCCRDSCYYTDQNFIITNQLYGTASVTVAAPPTDQNPPPYESPPEYNSIIN